MSEAERTSALALYDGYFSEDTPMRKRQAEAEFDTETLPSLEAALEIRPTEDWPVEEWKPFLAALTQANERNIAVVIQCAKCAAAIIPSTLDAEGARRVECACTVRRWLDAREAE